MGFSLRQSKSGPQKGSAQPRIITKDNITYLQTRDHNRGYFKRCHTSDGSFNLSISFADFDMLSQYEYFTCQQTLVPIAEFTVGLFCIIDGDSASRHGNIRLQHHFKAIFQSPILMGSAIDDHGNTAFNRGICQLETRL